MFMPPPKYLQGLCEEAIQKDLGYKNKVVIVEKVKRNKDLISEEQEIENEIENSENQIGEYLVSR
jgi:hypothetical protein